MANIMIIDDSQAVRGHLREVLMAAGHTVLEGIDGKDGLEKLVKSTNVDLVITDYNMPVFDGITMLVMARERVKELDKIPVFMLTTETSAQLKVVGKQVGILAWIVKPFSPNALIAAIATVLARSKKT